MPLTSPVVFKFTPDPLGNYFPVALSDESIKDITLAIQRRPASSGRRIDRISGEPFAPKHDPVPDVEHSTEG